MKMLEFIKKNFRYIFLFIFFFLALHFFYAHMSGDQIYNYGFSYAMSRGEILYKDFNLLIPPVGPIVYLLPFLFGTSFIVFNAYQAILICVLFHFLFKLFDNKAWFFLIAFVFPIPIPYITALFQGYNFLLILELVILLWLEKEKKNDYLIGVILGLCVFTKQTVGVAFCLVSIFYLFKDYKKVVRRFLGFLIPCFVFLFYFLITGTLYSFFDMCLFGMFDFTSGNSGVYKIISDFYFWVFLLQFGYLIFRIIKNYRNIRNYYILAFSLVSIPLFDYNHVAYFSFVFLFLFIDAFNFRRKSIRFNICLFSCLFSVVWCYFVNGKTFPNLVKLDNFGYIVMYDNNYKEIKMLVDYFDKHDNTIILSENSYVVKVAADRDIDYFDLLNKGNHGYNGTEKVIKKFDEYNDTFIILNIEAYNKFNLRQQINKDVMKYVMDNYEKVGELDERYYIYYKE